MEIDHLAVVCADLEQGAAFVEAALGVDHVLGYVPPKPLATRNFSSGLSDP